VALVRI